jgi:prepilin-type N-terminal cleavage/methylation domain-containing protein
VNRNAFTLMEVLLVIALLGVTAAVVWPDFFQARHAEQLDESARRMNTLIQMCRAQAMNETRRYCISFWQDGSIELTRQRDPILAPHEYFRFQEPWANTQVLLENVWVESILPLPEGPAPMDIQDDLVEFKQLNLEPTRISDLEQPFALYFEADGISPCLQWTLRDDAGRGIRMTLDGRLGRVKIDPVKLISDGLERPDRLTNEKQDLKTEAEQPELGEELLP